MREHVMITELFIILDSMEVNKLRTNNLANNLANNLLNNLVNNFVNNFVNNLAKKHSIVNYVFFFL